MMLRFMQIFIVGLCVCSLSAGVVAAAGVKGEIVVNKGAAPTEGPLNLGDITYDTGLGVVGGSDLTLNLTGGDARFEAWVGVVEPDRKKPEKRSGRFRAYADGKLVFDSGVINQTHKRTGQNPTRPTRVLLSITKVKKLRLTFLCEDDQDPSTLRGGWGEARTVVWDAPEYTVGKDEGKSLSPTPPMGWNSWCRYGTGIDEKLIRGVADAMVESGMRDAGYLYLGLDDGWQPSGPMFDEEGYPLWNKEKFPSGIKALADYVHAKGLKIGIYSRPGWVGGNEEKFAERFAEWGIDLLKYDFSTLVEEKKMIDATHDAGRDVVFSVCEWGREKPWEWAPGFGAEMWRSTYDMKDKWTSIYDNNGGIGVVRSAHQNEALGRFVGQGRWNDLDMLQVGVDGFDYGHDRKKSGHDITPDEERLQMTLWSILASPLLAATDVTAMTDVTKSILLDKDVIAIDQDALGVPGWRVEKLDTLEVWKRPLAGGDLAVAFVNLGDEASDMDVTWAQLNIRGAYTAFDIWQKRDLGKKRRVLKTKAVPSHGVVLVRLSK